MSDTNDDLFVQTLAYLMGSVAILQADLIITRAALFAYWQKQSDAETVESAKKKMQDRFESVLQETLSRLPPVAEQIQQQILSEVQRILKGAQDS